MKKTRDIVEAIVLLFIVVASFSIGIAWERIQNELDYAQAKGQCNSTATKTRYAAKDTDGWVCFIQHWEDKRKPRITMARLTIE